MSPPCSWLKLICDATEGSVLVVRLELRCQAMDTYPEQSSR
ncbi:hypothetical protein [Streptomyces sp. NPDC049040]